MINKGKPQLQVKQHTVATVLVCALEKGSGNIALGIPMHVDA